ncbi:MAG: DUF4258 domain-containing protein [candidate division Zixibacteria bacterium]|nr:DUF4258 domain-containing protein [Candidatus Tariuqbacter arcticus]
MKKLVWTHHAKENLLEREINAQEVYLTLKNPEIRQPGIKGRIILVRTYFDTSLNQKMLLRLIIEETVAEIKIITLYKTSKIEKYYRR